jgi:hypothetical protein
MFHVMITRAVIATAAFFVLGCAVFALIVR